MREKRNLLRPTLFDQYQVYNINWDHVDYSLSINKRNFLFLEISILRLVIVFSHAYSMYLLTNIKYTTVGLCMHTMSIWYQCALHCCYTFMRMKVIFHSIFQPGAQLWSKCQLAQLTLSHSTCQISHTLIKRELSWRNSW